MKFTRSLALLSLLVCAFPLMALKPTNQSAVAEQQEAPRAWFSTRNVVAGLAALAGIALLIRRFKPQAASAANPKRPGGGGLGSFGTAAAAAAVARKKVEHRIEINPLEIPRNQSLTPLNTVFVDPAQHDGWWFIVQNKDALNEIGMAASNPDCYQVQWIQYDASGSGPVFTNLTQPSANAASAAGGHDLTKDLRVWARANPDAPFTKQTINLDGRGLANVAITLNSAFSATLSALQPLSAAGAANTGAV